jgi:SAM-dependent methyltransferase
LSAFETRPRITLNEMWQQLDAIWIAMDLDRSRSERRLADYYNHPVWILNGIFTATDPVSVRHRLAIAKWVASHGVRRIADFGGGSGSLARAIAEASPDTRVDIIEPYPSQICRHLTERCPRVYWLGALETDYDGVISQDVLEHVEDPVGTTARVVGALRDGGHAIFANCFYPVIRCHLPETFFLRFTFDKVVQPLGLSFRYQIAEAAHVRVYRKQEIDMPAQQALATVRRRESVARFVGPTLNAGMAIALAIRRAIQGGCNAAN